MLDVLTNKFYLLSKPVIPISETKVTKNLLTITKNGAEYFFVAAIYRIFV